MHRYFKAFVHSLSFAVALCAAAQAQAGDQGVSANEIKLGASVVLSGPLGPQTSEYGAGSRLYFDSVNAAGGVHGRKISYVTIDDGFDAKRAVANTRKLIDESGVFMIYNNTGTAQTAAILPLLEESKTIVFGPVSGASMFRDKYNRYVFNVRAGYAAEAKRILSQLTLIGISRIAVFYQDDGLGKTLLGELRTAASAEKLSFVAEIKLDTAKPDFAAAADATAKAQPQVVILATAGTTFTNYVNAVLKTAAAPPGFYGFSVASQDVIAREVKERARGIVLAQVMPSLRNPSVPIVAEYLKLLGERSPDAKPSASQFEGFVHAKLLVTGLRRAGRELSTESFIKAMESAGDVAFGHFIARYTPQSHVGSTYVELAIMDNTGQLRY